MNVCENVIVGARLFSDRDAILFDDLRLTYADIERLSSQAASVLQELGVREGDRVGLTLPNVPAFVVWYYASLRLGAVAVSVSTRLTAEEVAFILDDCQAQVCIVDDAVDRAFDGALPDCVAHVVRVTETGDHYDGQALSSRPLVQLPGFVDREPDDPAVILYTSGTTGFPKGATLSHRNVRATVHAFNHLCGMDDQDRLLLAVPLFHCYGQNALLNSGLNVGATLILQRRFDLVESKRLIADHQVTKLFGVPTTFQLMWESCEADDLQSVGYCFSAAATLPIQLSRRWREKFSMPIYEGYGLTETAPFASYNHRLRHKPGSIGTPVDLVEMRVVDPDTGRRCPPGVPGEIAIRGPNVMLGYWNRAHETSQAIREGWFYSGDIGKQDEDGYFYIVDRLKDMITVGGMKVFPAEVERVLLDHPHISEAAVVGFPDDVFGEKVVAFLVSDEQGFDARNVQQYVQRQLAAYKSPRAIVLVEELPRNPAGKVLKTKLRERALSELESEVWEHTTAEHSTTPMGDQPPTTTESPFAAALAGAAGGLADALRNVHPAGRHRHAVSLIQRELQDLFSLDEVPSAEESLVESGLDSLMIVALRDRLQHAMGSGPELPATMVFDHPRIADLATYLVDQIDAGDASLPSAAVVAGPSSSPSSVTSAAAVGSTDQANSQPASTSDIASMSDDQALQELLRELNE